ncbi:MAG: hypothetical protein R2724_09845 [Bryobacterales bacterium]
MSDQIEAIRKDSCPACGAQAVWNPAKQALICPYCGTEAPTELNPDTGQIQEIDLVKTLREMPEELRLEDAEADRKVPELPRGLGLRRERGRQELRLLRLARAGRLRRDQGPYPATKPLAVQGG